MRKGIKLLISELWDPAFIGNYTAEGIHYLPEFLKESRSNVLSILNIDNTLENDAMKVAIKTNYAAFCLRFHPDKTQNHLQKTEIFKLVHAAYQVYRQEELPFISLCTTPYRFFHEDIQSMNHVNGKTLFSSERGDMNGITQSQCGNYLACSNANSGKLIVLERNHDKPLQVISHARGGHRMAFSPNAQYLAYSGLVFSFDIIALSSKYCVKKAEPGEPHYWAIACCEQTGNFLVGTENGSVKTYDSQSGLYLGAWTAHKREVHMILPIPDTPYLLTGSADHTIKLWNRHTKQCVHVFTEFNHIVYHIALSPDKKYLVAGAFDGYFGIWDFEHKTLITQFEGYQWIHGPRGIVCANRGVMVSPDSRYFISISNCQTVKVWDLATGQLMGLKNLPAHPTSVCFSKEQIFLGFDDGSIRQFSISDFASQCLPSSRPCLQTPLLF